MPASYFIDTPRRAVFIRAWDRLTDGEVGSILQALYSDKRFADDYVALHDYRAITRLDLTSAMVQVAASFIAAKREVRRAVVVGSDEVFGMVRMLQLFSSAAPESFAVCRDLEPALEWLGLERSMAWPADGPDVVMDGA